MASEQEPARADLPRTIEMPAPTIWPLVLAVGVALLLAGLLTSLAMSAVGAVVALCGVVGWVRELMPGAGVAYEEVVPPELRPRPVTPAAARVETMRPGMPGYRMHLPEKIHPYSAGAKGGLAGGVAMAVVAVAYGLVARGSLWYPINLLAGTILPGMIDPSAPAEEQLAALKGFHPGWLVTAVVIHVVLSVGLGLIYGVILPTLPRRPILWGGVVLPLLWTGAVYALMRVLNPTMQQHVDWLWFLVSQVAYGVTTGYVVMRSELVYASRLRGTRLAPGERG
jgi:hypothetical protein